MLSTCIYIPSSSALFVVSSFTSPRRLILDNGTPEGKTLKQFCSNFSVLEKNPATLAMNVRQFIDDMRAYILDRRADELTKIAVESNMVHLYHPVGCKQESLSTYCLSDRTWAKTINPYHQW